MALTTGRPPVFRRPSRLRIFIGGTGVGGTALAFSLWPFGSGGEQQKEKESMKAVEGNSERPSLNPSDEYLGEIISRADQLYDAYLIDNLYALLSRFDTSNNTEILWRLARATCEKAKQSTDRTHRNELMIKALQLVERAIANEPPEGSFGAHKWYAFLLDYVGEIEGRKARIQRSFDVRKHLERALELNPRDATTWHSLGVWHFTFANLSGLERMGASVLFATPPTSTFQDALTYFERAEDIQPNFYSKNLWYLAEVWRALGHPDKAADFYRRAFNLPIVSVDDKEVHENSFKALQKMGQEVHLESPKAQI